MARNKRNIRTTNRELYSMLKKLHIQNNVVLSNTKISQVNKILRGVNKNKLILEATKKDDKIILKKLNPFNSKDFNIFLK